MSAGIQQLEYCWQKKSYERKLKKFTLGVQQIQIVEMDALKQQTEAFLQEAREFHQAEKEKVINQMLEKSEIARLKNTGIIQKLQSQVEAVTRKNVHLQDVLKEITASRKMSLPFSASNPSVRQVLAQTQACSLTPRSRRRSNLVGALRKGSVQGACTNDTASKDVSNSNVGKENSSISASKEKTVAAILDRSLLGSMYFADICDVAEPKE